MTVCIETDRGPWVQALIAAGCRVHAANPRQAARFKERYGTSGAKSDKGDPRAGGHGPHRRRAACGRLVPTVASTPVAVAWTSVVHDLRYSPL
ncbi:hypothetical protein [Kitasatospora sp. NPDC091276]|uniref:hypothetical protein n=1 Tax=Kitasatospora sp. NPDC091276 TaxID=3155300 RepID=UPI0034369394